MNDRPTESTSSPRLEIAHATAAMASPFVPSSRGGGTKMRGCGGGSGVGACGGSQPPGSSCSDMRGLCQAGPLALGGP